MNIVVVESPAKAKTINKYLGKDYHVLASYGHVRDLPPKDGSVRPTDDFAMDWAVDEKSEKRVKEIARAVREGGKLYLATDPDREGEAISWHLAEELRRRKVLKGVDVKRVVFNEITKRAVSEAFANPRDLNKELIEAYLARRALDYLVGFSLSPVLWRKIPGSRSAGRVQSVALRLICEREAEIEAFKSREYWTVEVDFATANGAVFRARLTHLDTRKLEKFDLANESDAQAAVRTLEAASGFEVLNLETKQVKRNPAPPFTTSTLQQEASRKLGLSATRTMRIAQSLYEGVDLAGETVGLITYMRTDGVQIANEALAAVRDVIGSEIGSRYLPGSPRIYKTKAKNAQEAHEAIRPTDVRRRPADVAHSLKSDELKLYELIWKRTIASQMESALFDQASVDIAATDRSAQLRATGSVLVFDGFLNLYMEGRDDQSDAPSDAPNEDEERRLPHLERGDALTRRKVTPSQHFTQPPPRFSEASLVKKLEELGIGRPSTYATILQVLQDREYVRLDKRRFVPEDRGRVVTAFLTSFFERYVQYNFTALLEEQLDDISGGRINWKQMLREFWDSFSAAVEETKHLRISDVVDALDRELGPHFFPADPEHPDSDARKCPACGEGRLGLRLGRTGGFIGCSNYPDCRYTRPLAVTGDESGGAEHAMSGPVELGTEPEGGEQVTLRQGPYGVYIQLGEASGKEKPKRVSLPPGLSPDEVTLEKALALLALPREIGKHPDSGDPITAGIGRFGPYIRHGSTYRSLPEDEDVLTVGLNRAVTLLAEQEAKRGKPATALGEHPADGKPVSLGRGRFGPYVRHGKLFASIPKNREPESITLDEAVELLAAQAEKKGKKETNQKKETKQSKGKKGTRRSGSSTAKSSTGQSG